MKTDSAATLDRLAARAGQLYSLPTVAMQILKLTSNPAVDVRAIKDCIENDPALTSKILRVVNSSLFGLSREVSDLNQALALLGTKPLKLLVLGFSLPSGLFAAVEGEILAQYWRHTLTKAVAGREISETLWRQPGDDAFIAGLLQDLGMLLLIQQLGDPYVKFLRKVWGEGKNLLEMENQSLGFDHTELSARLLERWGLPAALVEAAAWEPEYASSAPQGESALPRIVHLSELTAQLLADNRPQVLPRLLQVGQDYCRLTQEQLTALVGRLEEKVRQLADVLSLQLPEGVEYHDVLIEAHARLSEAACEAAGDLVQAHFEGVKMAEEEESLAAEIQDLHRAIASLAYRPKAKPAPAAVTESPEEPAAAPAVPRPVETKVVAAATVSPASAPGGIRPGLSTDPVYETHLDQSLPRPCFEPELLIPELSALLTAAVAACRQARCPLSLLLIKFDHSPDPRRADGADGISDLMPLFESACRNLDHPGMHCVAYGPAGFALIFPDCERRTAVEYGGELLQAFQRLVPQDAGPAGRPSRASVGAATVALPPRNFPPQDLLTAANRCLYGSQASGGGVVKSIEIY
ncbi:MAG: HDOD domain-containing protein [Pirellulales bacterium]|nr:HDOD domain-containing protein [Pirellulales bacterium]